MSFAPASPAPSAASAPADPPDPRAQDLGPLTWVLEDVRRCLDQAARAVAAGQPAQAEAPLHQAAGALEMAGHPGASGAARVVNAMELLARHLAAHPPADAATAGQASQAMAHAVFAVTDFLDAVLHGRSAHPVALYPNYHALLALAGEARAPGRSPDRVLLRAHPSVLWTPPAGLDLSPLEVPEAEPPEEAIESIELSAAGPDQFHVAQISEPTAAPFPSGAALRARLDQAVLQFVKAGDPAAARELSFLCAGLVSRLPADDTPEWRRWRRLWRLAAAFFEAQALDPSLTDLPAKRSASRLLVAYAQQASAAPADLEALAHDLLYACAATGPVDAGKAPCLAALRSACGLADAPALDHQSAPFGRYDPAVLAIARKRLAAAREGWAALSGGEVLQLRATVDHLASVAEVLPRLHEPLTPLAQALSSVADQLAALADPPAAPLAMEVATAILFLEALCQDFDPHDALQGERAQRLAARLGRVQRGAAPEPLEPWVEGLFRQASDRQTLGSVVDELRASLGELEKDLDAFFRQRADRTPLQAAPGRLSQMRGVLSVLGLDQAARAVLRMRDQVQLLWAEPEGPQAAALVEALGQNLGALGFLIDMLHYQPHLARELFVFDEASGELRPEMGRAAPPSPPSPLAAFSPVAPTPGPEVSGVLPQEAFTDAFPVDAAEVAEVTEAAEAVEPGAGLALDFVLEPADVAFDATLPEPTPAPPAPDHPPEPPPLPVEEPDPEPLPVPGPVLEPGVDGDAELRSIFLEEAREVLAEGRQALAVLGHSPGDLATLAALRRCFHTLKGSARMVGLEEFGAAAWSLEQLLNAWLAEARAADPALCGVTAQALEALARWVEDLANAGEGDADALGWRASDVNGPAEAVRAQGQSRPVSAAGAAEAGEEIREVGPLRIPAGLFNVYLQEADEDSLRLQEGLSAWSLAPALPPSQELELLAHSLAGSSATVGFAGLAEIARLLELVLQRQPHRAVMGSDGAASATELAEAAALLVAAGEHVRQLLHQFAAGFLREPDAGLLERLRQLASREPAQTLDIDLGQLPDGEPDPMVFSLFEEEALELLPRLDAAVRAWAERPADASPHAEVLRLLHTLKGGARLVGLQGLGELAHALESEAEALPSPSDPGRGEAVTALCHRIDQLQSAFEALRLRQSPPSASARAAAGMTSAQGPVDAADLPARPTAEPDSTPVLELPSSSTGTPNAAPSSGVVRVRAQLLDRLMNQAGEVMITGARLESALGGMREGLQDLSSSVERLRQQLREAEIQAETQMQSRAPQGPAAAGFDPLELDRFTRMQELTRSMAESVNDIAALQRQLARAVDAGEDDLSAQSRQTRDLQRDLLRTRMLEFGSIAERLRRVVRQAAQECGKEARLEIEGESLEIDRGMLDRMTPVFEHLLRNAVAHGIEAAADRRQAGKPASGLLRIRVEQAGNDIALRFEDDGAGLDLARIADKAQRLGLQHARDDLPPQAAADLIFRPGFSTASSVSELAGRGVGLDVVRAEVQALGGRIEVESQQGLGCCFRLLLPLTTAVTHVVLMRCGALRFGVPASLVETVLRSEPQVLAEAQASGQWVGEGGASLPFFWGGALLRASRASQEAAGRAVPVALLQSAAQRLALQVDEVLGHREVVVKHLGPQLARLPGLAGMTVLASGEVVLIYNPVALAAIYGERARQFAAGEGGSGAEAGSALPASGDRASGEAGQTASDRATQPPLVLVVDDSLTVRRVTQRLLQREGYRVALAADGLQALERLAQEAPALVLSDIEMPRMDGFELARHLRGDPRWSGLPLVFITSRTAPKHREHAETLGVDHYLGKPYAEDELLALCRRYTLPGQGAPAAP